MFSFHIFSIHPFLNNNCNLRGHQKFVTLVSAVEGGENPPLCRNGELFG